MQTFLKDVQYALRMFRKNFMLSAVIVASLAIGIGANSAIFSVVDALLLRPLPYPHAERLAAVWLHSPAIGILRDWPSPGQYIDIQNENHSFEEMALAQGRAFVLSSRSEFLEHVRSPACWRCWGQSLYWGVCCCRRTTSPARRMWRF